MGKWMGNEKGQIKRVSFVAESLNVSVVTDT